MEKPRKSADMSDMVHRIKTEEAKGRLESRRAFCSDPDCPQSFATHYADICGVVRQINKDTK
jgi:hypothetical protein